MKLNAIRAVEKKWNCRIDWVNLGWDGIIESINTTVPAGKSECDIYLTDIQFGLAPVARGYAQKLSDICPDGDVNNSQMVFTKNEYLGMDDYFFSGSTTISSGAMYMCYNAQMIDAEGLERPEKLAENGEWTWEKFNEYARLLTKDTDADGNTDIYGFGTAWSLAVQGFAASNNAILVGSEKQTMDSRESIEAFKEIRQLYGIDKSARPFNKEDWDDNLTAVSQGKVAFAFTQPWILVKEKNNHDFDIRICPAPSGPHGDDTMSPVQIVNNYFIPKGVENPTAVYQIFEEINNWFLGDTQIRDDTEWFDSAFTDREQVALAIEIGNKSNNDIWNMVDTSNVVSTVFFGACQYPEMDMEDEVRKVAGQLQLEIDSFLTEGVSP
jgi:ABC-type glycerol-3-phosphate transport system substrate-binding protein